MELNKLYEQLNATQDFVEQMEIQSLIDDIELKGGIQLPPKPADSPYFCEGCGS